MLGVQGFSRASVPYTGISPALLFLYMMWGRGVTRAAVTFYGGFYRAAVPLYGGGGSPELLFLYTGVSPELLFLYTGVSPELPFLSI